MGSKSGDPQTLDHLSLGSKSAIIAREQDSVNGARSQDLDKTGSLSFPTGTGFMSEKYTQIAKTMIGESQPRQLPFNIISEILSRATVETLHTCKQVSKKWRDFISDPAFTTSYNESHKYIGYFIQDFRPTRAFIPNPMFVSLGEQNEDPFALHLELPKGKKILALCKQGIVLCKNLKQDEYDYYVGKPVARRWVPLPNPNPRHHGRIYVLGIVVLESNPMWFKVVRLEWAGRELHYMIFNSKKWEWGKNIVVASPVRPMISPGCPSVSVSESFYCQTYNNRRNHIIAFNGLYDSVHIFTLPDPVKCCDHFIYDYMQLQEFDQSPVLVCLRRDGVLELWEIKDTITHLPRENGGTVVSIDYQWCKKMEVEVENSREYRRIEGCDHQFSYSKILDETVIYSWQPGDMPHYDIYAFHDSSVLA